MAVDSRIKDLPDEVASSQLQALLDTLYLAVDDTSFSEAKKVLLKTLFTEAIVSSNSNNYQAMTPKAFYNSIMTTSRKGIGRLATESEINSKTGDGLLTAAAQTIMQTQWYKDWFVSNSTPNVYYANSDSNSVMKALIFSVNFEQSVANGGVLYIGPTLGAGRTYKTAWIQFSVSNSVVSQAGYSSLTYAGIQVLVNIATGMYIGINAAGTGLFFYNTGATATFRFSGSFNVILD